MATTHLMAMHWLCSIIWFMRLASSLSSSRISAAASLMAASAAAFVRSSSVSSPLSSLSCSAYRQPRMLCSVLEAAEHVVLAETS